MAAAPLAPPAVPVVVAAAAVPSPSVSLGHSTAAPAATVPVSAVAKAVPAAPLAVTRTPWPSTPPAGAAAAEAVSPAAPAAPAGPAAVSQPLVSATVAAADRGTTNHRRRVRGSAGRSVAYHNRCQQRITWTTITVAGKPLCWPSFPDASSARSAALRPS